MIDIIKFQVEHWDEIREQEATVHLRELIPREYVEALAACDHGYTVISEGRVVAFAGVLEHWPGRAEAWAEFSSTSRKEMLAVHRAVSRFLDMCPYARIEATVDLGFPQAHRWVRMLGFELEAECMSKYSPDGSDCSLYARVT